MKKVFTKFLTQSPRTRTEQQVALNKPCGCQNIQYSVASSQFYVVSQKFHTKKNNVSCTRSFTKLDFSPIDHDMTNMANVSHMQANKDTIPTQPNPTLEHPLPDFVLEGS